MAIVPGAENPVIVDVAINGITMVAEGAFVGNIRILDRNDVSYSHTYRLTGEAAPLYPEDEGEFVPFEKGSEFILSFVDIDVYVLVRSESRTGTTQMRLDA